VENEPEWAEGKWRRTHPVGTKSTWLLPSSEFLLNGEAGQRLYKQIGHITIAVAMRTMEKNQGGRESGVGRELFSTGNPGRK
jgi:hypothetical protein